MDITIKNKIERSLKFSKIFTDLAWDDCQVNVFGQKLMFIPKFHESYESFFEQLLPTMNFYTFKFLFCEHDDCIELGWISHKHEIYKKCFTKKYSKNFLKAGTASAINAMKELAKKEIDETNRVS